MIRRQVGRKVDPKSVTFQLGGTVLRIPYELALPAGQRVGRDIREVPHIYFSAYLRGSTVVLQPSNSGIKMYSNMLKGWKSKPAAKSLLVCCSSILNALHLTPAMCNGKSYRAWCKSGKILIDMEKEV